MIQHIFFDLDRTLWDFEKNTKFTLMDMFSTFNLESIFPSFEAFFAKYKEVNDKFWSDYRKGKIDKQYLIDNRYTETLKAFHVKDPILGKGWGSSISKNHLINQLYFLKRMKF